MSTFHFKEFSIRQSHAAMKVGTDALLLGSLAEFNHPSSLLDLGTGTGVLSLMLAQRYPGLQVTAIERDPLACTDAQFNFSQQAFPSNNFELIEADIRDWQATTTFDAIISNPPYFGNSYKSENTARNTARHTDDTLSFSDLATSVCRHLSDTGIFWCILPYHEKNNFIELCMHSGLFARKIITINGKPGNPVRVVFAFSRESGDCPEAFITVRNNDGAYTQEYIELTRAYHAKDLSHTK